MLVWLLLSCLFAFSLSTESCSSCTYDVPVFHTGLCPHALSQSKGTSACASDNDCEADEKCCGNLFGTFVCAKSVAVACKDCIGYEEDTEIDVNVDVVADVLDILHLGVAADVDINLKECLTDLDNLLPELGETVKGLLSTLSHLRINDLLNAILSLVDNILSLLTGARRYNNDLKADNKVLSADVDARIRLLCINVDANVDLRVGYHDRCLSDGADEAVIAVNLGKFVNSLLGEVLDIVAGLLDRLTYDILAVEQTLQNLLCGLSELYQLPLVGNLLHTTVGLTKVASLEAAALTSYTSQTLRDLTWNRYNNINQWADGIWKLLASGRKTTRGIVAGTISAVESFDLFKALCLNVDLDIKVVISDLLRLFCLNVADVLDISLDVDVNGAIEIDLQVSVNLGEEGCDNVVSRLIGEVRAILVSLGCALDNLLVTCDGCSAKRSDNTTTLNVKVVVRV